MQANASATHHLLTRTVGRALRRRCGVRPTANGTCGPRLLVAVSGGADSVALLRVLAALAPRRRWRLRLAVGHVHHGLREDADEDAEFTRRLAAEQGLAMMTRRIDLSQNSANLEAQARRQRYAALRAMAAAWQAQAVAVAHHADDQLETLLMRLVRGASVRGMSGMAWQTLFPDLAGHNHRPQPLSCHLIRPALAVTRAEIEKFLRDLGQPWRLDPTNADATRWRARLRRDVLPVLADLRPEVGSKAVALCDHLREVQKLIDEQVAWWERWEGGGAWESQGLWLSREQGRAMNRAVLTALLRRGLERAGAPSDRLGRRALEPVLRAIGDAAGGERGFTLSGGVRVCLSRESIRILRA